MYLGGHEDIRQEPFVGLWSGALQARLPESQLPSLKLKRAMIFRL